MRLSLERLELRENPSPAGPTVNDPLAPPDPNQAPLPPGIVNPPPPADPSLPPPVIPPVIW